MASSIYSFGKYSPLKFEVSDKTAERYNQAVEEYFKAHRRFIQKFGKKWTDADKPLKVRWTRSQRRAWNDFAKIFNEAVKREGSFYANDIMDDYLVKNAPAVLDSMMSNKWGRVLTMAAIGGALYGVLSRCSDPS